MYNGAELNIELPYDPAIPPKRIGKRCSNKNLQMNVHNAIHNKQKMEIIQMSISWCLGKQNMYIHMMKYYIQQ